MADSVNQHTDWYASLARLDIVPPEYSYVIRMISWVFIFLGLAPILPIIILIVYDILLWMWRLQRHKMDSLRTQRYTRTTEQVAAGSVTRPVPESRPRPGQGPPPDATKVTAEAEVYRVNNGATARAKRD